MSRILIILLLVAILPAHTAAQMTFDGGVGNCFPPDDPYPYKLAKADPLYETSRDEHQRHLEDMEKYVNCLDRERSVALSQFRASYNLFKKNFGKDAVFKYGPDRTE